MKTSSLTPGSEPASPAPQSALPPAVRETVIQAEAGMRYRPLQAGAEPLVPVRQGEDLVLEGAPRPVRVRGFFKTCVDGACSVELPAAGGEATVLTGDSVVAGAEPATPGEPAPLYLAQGPSGTASDATPGPDGTPAPEGFAAGRVLGFGLLGLGGGLLAFGLDGSGGNGGGAPAGGAGGGGTFPPPGGTTPDPAVEAPPAISGATGARGNLLNTGDTVTVSVLFSKEVVVTGTPQLALNLGGSTVQADYLSGSGTDTLLFRYTIQAGDTDADGIRIEANSLSPNDGSITNAIGREADLSHAAVADNPGYLVDATAPNAPVINTVATDNVINAGEQTATISGTAEADATIALSLGGNVRTVTADGSGNWSYTLIAADITAMGQGPETLSATATDAAGNTSTAGTRGISIDTGIPAAPAINTVATDNVINTSEQTATITGTAEASATIALSLGGNVRTVTANGSGNWSYTLVAADITAMGQGAEMLSATATDAAGNTSAAGTRSITVDTQAPNAPVINTVASDDIINASEQTATITGTAEANATIALTLGSGNVRTVTANGSGNWSYTLIAADITAMGQGPETLSATATDAFGNTSGTGTRAITVDTTNAVSLATVATGTGGFVINGQSESDLSGVSVSSAGDVNGDGFGDLIVGAGYADPAALPDAGKSYVVFGKADGTAINLSDIAAGTGGFVINGEAVADRAGYSVSSAGDVNGDGLDDLIVGAFLADPAAGTDAGKSYVVFGKADGTAINLSDIAAGTGGFVINGQAAFDYSGYSVSGAGDVNGDGLDDLIVGAPAAGKSYVVFGKADGNAMNLADVAAGIGGFVINGQATSDISGWSVSGAGDVNGDGLDDLLVGAPNADPAALPYAGKSYVVFGKADGTAINLSDIAAGTGGFVINGQAAVDYSGDSVSGAGDVNGDGLDDLIVGADYADPAALPDAGKSYVVFGKADGTAINLSDIAAGTGGFVINGEAVGDRAGYSVSSAGDVNGDGLDDLIVGAFLADPAAGTDAGKSYVVFGKTDGASVDLATIEAGTGGFVISGQAADDYSGSSVSGAGDVNGDGFDDLLVGAYGADPATGSSAGKSYVIFGGNAGYTTGLVDFLGTTGDDTLTGTSANEQFVAGAGNDTLTGNGGKDVMYGGAGDDTFVLNASNITNLADNNNDASAIMRVGGGTGSDTLQLSGSNIALDLTALPDNRVTGIDVIDLTGSGDNSLKLIYTDLLALTDDNRLYVNGNAGDRVTMLGATSVDTGVDVDGTIYNTYHLGGSADADVWVEQWTTVVTSLDVELAEIAAGTSGFVINGRTADENSGYSVSGAGDVNGDGLEDLIVGGPFAGGKGYVVFGKEDGSPINLSDVAAGTGGFVINGQASGRAGFSVSGAGDVNADGLADLVVGDYLTGGSYQGRGYVVFGKADGTGVSLADVAAGTGGGFVMNGDAGNDQAGVSVSDAGDVNGDGLDDVIVGATVTGGAPGKSYVVFGKTDATAINLAGVAAGTGGFVINGQAVHDYAGRSVSAAGDVNGDGLDDLVIGASGSTGTPTGTGYVVFGKTGTASVSLVDVAAGAGGGFVMNGVETDDYTGWSVSGVGDINGDGLADLIVGAPGAWGDPFELEPVPGGIGKTYVVFGKASSTAVDLASIAAGTGGFIINGEVAGDRAGYSVSSAGDVNGDGLDDILIGTSSADPDAGVDAGKSYLVFGKTDGSAINLADVAAGTGGFVINGQAADDYSGFLVSGAGDVNGDGFADLIVGAPFADPAGGSAAGKSYVIFGGNTGYTTGLVDFLGGTGNDALTGSSDNEQFAAGAGHDTLTGNGGKDVMYGGAGDDTFVLNADNVTNLADNSNDASAIMRVDGGTGADTLQLSGSNIALDFTAIAGNRVTGIDVVDLTGSGNNSLTLNYTDLLHLGDDNALFVKGNAGDTVTITGATSVATGVDVGGITYDTYHLGGSADADVWVQQGVNVVV